MAISLAQLVGKYPNAVNVLVKVPLVHKHLNRYLIGKYAGIAPPRPRQFSLKSDYTSWASLTDKHFTGRHLPRDVSGRDYPDIDRVTALWRRKKGGEVPSNDTSVLFAFFAQWFTDSFLRTDNTDPSKNNSNHEIDFCQLYGQTEVQSDILRLKAGGKLRYQMINDEMYPPYLFDPKRTTKAKWVFANHDFSNLHSAEKLTANIRNADEARVKYMFATGLEHGNTQIGYTMLSVIFLREHNRICDDLATSYSDWNDERLFDTARAIMTILLLNIILGEYVAQIGVVKFPFKAEPGWAETQGWYRSNWINLEFSLLYRWHSMVPDHLTIGSQTLTAEDYRFNPQLIHKLGIEAIITAASRQTAGKIGLGNTHDMFLDDMPKGSGQPSVQQRSLNIARHFNLQPMNAYRSYFGLKPVTDFHDLVDDPDLAQRLKLIYGSPDNTEWMTGIFAEKHGSREMMGDLMVRMVAYDAFTHALTNPLLSKHIYGVQTFSARGLEIINSTGSLREIVARNVRDPAKMTVSFQSNRAVPGPRKFAPLLRITETLDFVFMRGWKGFYQAKRHKHGAPVFRSHALQSGIVILDPKACEVFTQWDGRLAKAEGFGAATVPRALTGGYMPSVFDNTQKHDLYKALYADILMTRRGDFNLLFKHSFIATPINGRLMTGFISRRASRPFASIFCSAGTLIFLLTQPVCAKPITTSLVINRCLPQS